MQERAAGGQRACARGGGSREFACLICMQSLSTLLLPFACPAVSTPSARRTGAPWDLTGSQAAGGRRYAATQLELYCAALGGLCSIQHGLQLYSVQRTAWRGPAFRCRIAACIDHTGCLPPLPCLL